MQKTSKRLLLNKLDGSPGVKDMFKVSRNVSRTKSARIFLFTCSKLKTGTSEKCAESVQVYSKDTRTTLLTSF